MPMKISTDRDIHFDLSLLKEIDGDDYVKEVVDLFLEKTPPLLEEMRIAVDKAEWEGIFQKAHKLRSSAGLLQMSLLLRSLEAIETAAKSKTNPDVIRQLFQTIQSEYNTASALLKEEIDRG